MVMSAQGFERPLRPAIGAGTAKGAGYLSPEGLKIEARNHARFALATFIEIMNNPDASENARLSASNSLLDRAYGKAMQLVETQDRPVLSTAALRSLDGTKVEIMLRSLLEAMTEDARMVTIQGQASVVTDADMVDTDSPAAETNERGDTVSSIAPGHK